MNIYRTLFATALLCGVAMPSAWAVQDQNASSDTRSDRRAAVSDTEADSSERNVATDDSQPRREQSRDAAGSDATEPEELQRKYLNKQVELAAHELDVVIRANEEIPLMYSKLTLLRLKKQLEHAKASLTAFKNRDQFDKNLPAASLKLVENEADIAQQRLRWAIEANQEVPGAVGEADLTAYRLKAEMARLALQRARQKGYFDDPMTHLQWQLNRLRSEVLELLVRMEQTEAGS